MRVFLAGATGAIGRSLLPLLVDAGHEVAAMTRSDANADIIRGAGAEPVVCDVFDAERLRRIVRAAKPDAVIHELTDIPKALDADPTRAEQQLTGNRRIRIEGTRNLVDAAVEAGATRIVAQSIAFVYARVGDAVKSEDDPLIDGPSADAVRALESAVTETPGIEGTVLRYGYFYGPGTFYARDGYLADLARRGELPIVGDGDDLTSFVHVDDAATTTLNALDGPTGVFNIVDDEPARQRDWLPVFAEALGAPSPTTMAADVSPGGYERGASNTKAKRLLRWSPRYPSWRDGFRDTLFD